MADLFSQADGWPPTSITTLAGIIVFAIGAFFGKMLPDALTFHYVTTAKRHAESTSNQDRILERQQRTIRLQKHQLVISRAILAKHNLTDEEQRQIDEAEFDNDIDGDDES